MPETTDIPLTGGLDLRDPRTLPLGSFSTLHNADFEPACVKRRHGHEGLNVSDDSLTGGAITINTGETEGYLFGYGRYNATSPTLVYDPMPGEIMGVATRGQEVLAWDGWRMLSRNLADGARWNRVGADLGSYDFPDAYFPVATEKEAIWRTLPSGTQRHYDMAVGRDYTVYLWIEDTTPKYSIVANASGASIATAETLSCSAATVTMARVVYSEDTDGAGAFYFVLNDSTNQDLYVEIMLEGLMRRYHIFGGYDPTEVVISSTLVSANTPFDVRPASSGRIAVLFVQSGPELRLVYVTMGAGTSGLTLGTSVTDGPVALAIHPDNTLLACHYWNDAGTVKAMARFYSATGVALYAATYMNSGAAITTLTRLTCEFRYLQNLSSEYRGVVGWFDSGGGTENVSVREIEGAATYGGARRLKNIQLTHQMCRIGDAVFLTCGYAPPLTACWQLVTFSVDPGLQAGSSRPALTPVSSAMRGTYRDDSSGAQYVRSVCAPPGQDRISPYRQIFINASGKAVPTLTAVTQSEVGARTVELDFLPRLRPLDRGHVTWFPGGVVREYDGATMTEVGFLAYPEPATPTAGAGGGLNAAAGTVLYQWRWYLCSRNAQGEVHRSTAITKSLTLTAAQNRATFTLPAIPLCTKSNVYWEGYRTQADGSSFTLLATEIPSSLATVRGADTTYVDDASDLSIVQNATDPSPAYTSSGLGLLDRVAPPACKHIAQGKGRIWFYGGAVPDSQVAYSRLFDPGDAPGWNEALTVVVPGSGEITGFGFLGDAALVLRKTEGYAFGNQGPDNLGQGDFDEPRPVPALTGCVTPDSVVQSPLGLAMQTSGGIRVVGAGFNVSNIGSQVDSAFTSETITAAARSDISSQLRFAVGTSAYVLDYSSPDNLRWTKWSLPANGFATIDGKVLVAPAMHLNTVYLEDPSVATDGGLGYSFDLETGWLAPNGAKLGWGRVDWLMGVGEWRGAHTLTGEVNYNYGWRQRDEWVWRPDAAIAIDQDYEFDISDDVNVGPGSPSNPARGYVISIPGGTYTQTSLLAKIRNQLPPNWTVGVNTNGKMEFEYLPGTIDITWRQTGIRDALGFTVDANDWDSTADGPFIATTALAAVADVSGAPVFGDVYGAGASLWYYGGPYLFRRRFRTQRASTFRLALSDTRADNDSFLLSALTVVHRPDAGGAKMGRRNLS